MVVRGSEVNMGSAWVIKSDLTSNFATRACSYGKLRDRIWSVLQIMSCKKMDFGTKWAKLRPKLSVLMVEAESLKFERLTMVSGQGMGGVGE